MFILCSPLQSCIHASQHNTTAHIPQQKFPQKPISELILKKLKSNILHTSIKCKTIHSLKTQFFFFLSYNQLLYSQQSNISTPKIFNVEHRRNLFGCPEKHRKRNKKVKSWKLSSQNGIARNVEFSSTKANSVAQQQRIE